MQDGNGINVVIYWEPSTVECYQGPMNMDLGKDSEVDSSPKLDLTLWKFFPLRRKNTSFFW